MNLSQKVISNPVSQISLTVATRMDPYYYVLTLSGMRVLEKARSVEELLRKKV